MDPSHIADTIFSVDRNIRYVGIVGPGPGYEIKASRMREGIKSLTPEEKDREFIQFLPEVILGIADKLKDDMGKIRYSLLCFQNATLMLLKTPGYVIVMSLEAGTYAKPIYDRLKPLMGLEQ